MRPGVDWLHRTTSAPQDIHAVRIDLGRGEVSLRASRDATGSERQVTTPTFAASVGAVVAINGDWSDGSTPVGLAIGDGWLWHDHLDDSSIGASWGYLACDAFNQCDLASLPLLSEAWWFTPTRWPYRYFNAVGANGVMLLDDGVRWDGCYDGCDGDTCRHPRSAACVDASGQYLWLIVVDGRRSDALGMTCSEVRDLAQDLGCWDAVMLDGGGSSTMVIDGLVRNEPSDGSPRTVANHLGVIYTERPDPSCAVHSGGWCEGTVLGWCTGGRLVGQGDCAYYGATCQEDEGWAFCVDYRCPGGDGMGATCLDATRVASCTDGVYGEGDCGAFGLVCGEDAQGGGCMDSRCAQGPHSGFCLDDQAYAQCTEGVYAEGSCAEGTTCEAAHGTVSCVGPGGEDGGATDGGGGDGGGTAADGAAADGGGATPGEGNRGQSYDPQGGCACGGAAPAGGLLLPGLLPGLLLALRRRSQS